MRTKILFLFAGVMLCLKLHAQKQLAQFIRDMNILDRPSVAYDYKITLLQVQSNVIEDSITGRIYKKAHEYLDSSSVAIALVNGDYYCKLDHQRREVSVYDLNLIQRKLNLKFDRSGSPAMIVADSIFIRYGQFRMDTTDSHYICHWRVGTDGGITSTAFVEKRTLKLSRLILELTEKDPDGASLYKRICTIYNIRNEFPDSAIDLSRFCQIDGGKVILNKKYAPYNLKTLIP